MLGSLLKRLVERSRPQWVRFLGSTRYERSTETVSLILSSILIGILMGLAATGFSLLVGGMGALVDRSQSALGGVAGRVVVVLFPALGGLLITPIVVRWAPEVRGSGIPSVMLAVSNFSGHMSRRLIVWRPIASAISIGTGASLGTEGPVVQMGGSLASGLSDLLGFNDERRKTLVGVAAASGVAATFNAPIAGVLFALEIVLGRFENRYVAAVVIGAVAASAVSGTLLGSNPAFAIPETYRLGSPVELVYYFALGLLCAFVAILFVRGVVLGENLFNRLRISPWLRPTLGGLLVGVLGLYLPVLGRGFAATSSILNGEVLGIGFLFAIVIGKMVATSVSLGSYGSGGVFAPLLLIGAAFGGGFAQLLNLAGMAVDSGAFALVGMAAMFSGAARTPISTIIMMLEMSDGYSLILPLLLATVVATLIAEVFHPESIYQVILSRKGLHLLRSRESDLFQTVKAKEAMDVNFPRLFADETLESFVEAVASSHQHGVLVMSREDPEHLIGIVTLSDMERARREGRPLGTSLSEVCTEDVLFALPDEPVSEVLERMAEHGIGGMPVVDGRDHRKPIGFVRQADLARTYYQVVQRQRHVEEREEVARLRDLTGQEIIEIRVRPDSPVAGKTLREAHLPHDSIVVAIRRKGRTIFPHGDTTLDVGDTVVARIAPGFGPSFRAIFGQ